MHDFFHVQFTNMCLTTGHLSIYFHLPLGEDGWFSHPRFISESQVQLEATRANVLCLYIVVVESREVMGGYLDLELVYDEVRLLSPDNNIKVTLFGINSQHCHLTTLVEIDSMRPCL